MPYRYPAWLSLFAVPCLLGLMAHSAPASDPERQLMVGAWNLVSIDYSGPAGPLPDPVFGPDPHGVIIYDSSGWMSVQIVTANRPTMKRPPTRTTGIVSSEDAQMKSQAFDTYYAYFGTWDYDATRKVVTHHLKSSLLPYETGQDYQRDVELRGSHLRLIAAMGEGNEARRRILTWERIP